MSTAVERTADLLARSRDEAAADILREALDRTDDAFGVEAALAIGRHGSMRMKNDVIRRVGSLSARQKDALRHKATAFADATAHGLRSPERSERLQAIEWIATVGDFERFPMLIELLVGRVRRSEGGEAVEDESASTAGGEEVSAIVLACEELVERMFDLFDGRDALEEVGERIRNADELRKVMAAALSEACLQLGTVPCPDQILQWTLILIDAESVALQKLANRLDEIDRSRLMRALLTGTHPGVMRLAWDLLRRGYPLPIVFDLWRQRQDPEFVCHLLDSQPTVPTTLQIQNLAQIDFVPWLADDPDEIEVRLRAIPPALLPNVVSLLELIALPNRQKKSVLRWLLANGDGPTRQRASAMFDLLGKQESHQIIADSLQHEDVGVQAWATGQLRPQDVPGAMRLLIERLDSPEEEIREAAREELSDFDFARMMRLIETDPDQVTPAMGRLILKVDPDTLDTARTELAHAIRGRRIRAVQAVVALEMAAELVDAIAALLDDSDMLVRRTAVEALGTVPTRASLIALDRACRDSSVRVRDAATEAMHAMRSVLIAQARAEAAAKRNEDAAEKTAEVTA